MISHEEYTYYVISVMFEPKTRDNNFHYKFLKLYRYFMFDHAMMKFLRDLGELFWKLSFNEVDAKLTFMEST